MTSSRILVLQVRDWLQSEKCSYAHRQVEEQPSKRSNKNGDKSAVAMLKNTRQSPKSSSILRKSSTISKSIRCVKFTKAVARHADIRDQNLRSEWHAQVILISATPMPQNLRIGLRRRQSDKSKKPVKQRGVWPKMCLKKEHERATVFSNSENWCLSASSIFKPEEREFVVDSGASMHMTSRKDWFMSKNWIFLDNESPRGYASSSVAGEALFVMNMDILTNGSTVKNHISLKMGIQCNTKNFVPIVPPALSSSSSFSSHSSTSMTLSKQERNHLASSSNSSTSPTTTVSSDSETGAREDLSRTDSHPVLVSSMLKIDRWDLLLPKPTKNPKPNENETTMERPVVFWYTGMTARIHSVCTHFPEDRNYEICQRTKITRAPCRRRMCGALPRAENFGDLITAEHKVLRKGCENNHRYAFVTQDLAVQWIQSHPCKTKTSQETQRILQKFLESDRKPEVICTDNSLEFDKVCEDLSWNHCTSTPHRWETNVIVERTVRRVKEDSSVAVLQSGQDDNWFPICETFKICYLMGRRRMKNMLDNHLQDWSFRLVHWLSITL